MITDPLFYLVAIPAILIFGISKGGFGGSAGALAVPMMSLMVDPRIAAAVMLPILIAMDAVAVWKFRKTFDRSHLKIIIPASVIGIALASLLMGVLSADHLRLLIGLIAVAFCLHYWFWPKAQSHQKPGKKAGWFWGAMSGFTSTQIHAGGVPISIYLLPQKMEKHLLIGTNAIFFACLNVMKLVPYTLLGQFDSTNLLTSLALMPLAPLGVFIGYALLVRVSQLWVYRWLYLFLFLAGGLLCWQGLKPILI